MRGDASGHQRDRWIGAPGRRARAARRGLIATATLAALGGLALAPAGGATAAQRHSSVSSAIGLLNLAFADARAKGSFHQSLSQIVGGTHGSLQDDVTLTSGRQAISSSDGTRAEVEVVGRTAYLTGNRHALRSYFKFTTKQIAVIGSNWVSIPSTSSAFASIAYDVTVPTALAEVAPSGHLTEGPPMTLDGQRVIAISGGAPAAFAGGTDGRATIYVTATSDPLPVRASLTVTQADHSKLVLTGTMSRWGEHVGVTAPAGQQLSAAQINALVGQLSNLAIPGQPGYFAVPGQDRHPTAAGRPWGQACRPMRLAVGTTVPDWIYRQVALVTAQARKRGIDVVLESRDFSWNHASLYYRAGQSAASSGVVRIGATGLTPSTTKNRLPMTLNWTTRADADGTHDDLSSITATFSLPVLNGRTQTVRRSIRQLIAWAQGVSETTDPISGITLRSFTDRFTRADVAAMLAMSGCARPSGNSVTGIAA